MGRLGGLRPDRRRRHLRRRSTPPQTSSAARNEAISYAAYRVLTARFIKAVGGADSLSEFADVMDGLCYPIDVTATEGDSPAAVGNRIAAAVLAYGLTDGSNQAGRLRRPDYTPVNEPLVVVAGPGIADDEPEPLAAAPDRAHDLAERHPGDNGVQQAVGPHWGHVTGFALPPGGRSRDADRPRAAAAARRAGHRPGLQGPGGRGHPRQQPARRQQRRDDRHLPRRPRRQHARHQRRRGACPSTRPPASRTRRTWSSRATSRVP